VVFSQDDILDPMQPVFNVPVLPNSLGKTRRIKG
jgi:hypothetical protein